MYDSAPNLVYPELPKPSEFSRKFKGTPLAPGPYINQSELLQKNPIKVPSQYYIDFRKAFMNIYI